MQLDRDIPEETVGGDDVWMARPFDRVPDNLLASLLRHLNMRDRLLAEFVCRRWRRLALDAAWTHVRSVDLGMLIVDGSLSRVPFHKVKAQRQATNLLEAIIERADLRELNLSAYRIDDDYFNTYIESTFISRVCSLCPALTVLDLTDIRLTKSTLCTIGAQLGGRLHSLSMGNCFNKAYDVVPDLGRLFADCTNLERLDLSDNGLVTGTNSFALLPVTLTSLNVERCRALTDAALCNVAERCGVLKELKLANQDALSPAAIQQYLGRLGSLRSLHFRDYVHDLEDNNGFFTTVGHLDNLQRLDLRDNNLVSDQTLMAVAHGCKKLHTLRLKRKRGLTDAGIGALAPLPNLTRLDLRSIESMTDAPLLAIAACGKLEVLLMRWCPLITDAALQCVAWCCEGLRGLCASQCPLVGDVTLQALLELVQRRDTADLLHVWLCNTAATQAAVVAHANLLVNFDYGGYCHVYDLFDDD